MWQINVKKLSYAIRLTMMILFFALSLHLPAEKCASFCSVPEFPASFPTSSKLRSVTLQLRCMLEAPRWLQGNCWNKPRISQVGICSFKLMITGQMSETAVAYYLFYWAAYCGKQISSAYRNPLGRALLSLWGQHRRFALCCSHLRNSSIWHTCGCEPIAILEEQCCCLKFFEIFKKKDIFMQCPHNMTLMWHITNIFYPTFAGEKDWILIH